MAILVPFSKLTKAATSAVRASTFRISLDDRCWMNGMGGESRFIIKLNDSLNMKNGVCIEKGIS